MTVGAGISVADRKLVVLGNCVLNDVHDNIEITPASGGGFINGAFIGVRSDQVGCRRVFPVGKLEYVPSSSFSSLLLFYFSLLLFSFL
jgi:raffinose synthase